MIQTPVEKLPDFPKKRRSAGLSSVPAESSAVCADSDDSLKERTTECASPDFEPNSLAGNTSTPGESDEEEVVKEEAHVDEEVLNQQSERMSKSAALPTGAMYEATETGLYRCTVCGRETKDRSNIRKHFLKWHAGEDFAFFFSS